MKSLLVLSVFSALSVVKKCVMRDDLSAFVGHSSSRNWKMAIAATAAVSALRILGPMRIN